MPKNILVLPVTRVVGKILMKTEWRTRFDAFLGISASCEINNLAGIKKPLWNKSTPRNQSFYRVTLESLLQKSSLVWEPSITQTVGRQIPQWIPLVCFWLLACVFKGIVILTIQPRSPARLNSSSEPPCASAIWRESTSPMPLPAGFVV